MVTAGPVQDVGCFLSNMPPHFPIALSHWHCCCLFW